MEVVLPWLKPWQHYMEEAILSYVLPNWDFCLHTSSQRISCLSFMGYLSWILMDQFCAQHAFHRMRCQLHSSTDGRIHWRHWSFFGTLQLTSTTTALNRGHNWTGGIWTLIWDSAHTSFSRIDINEPWTTTCLLLSLQWHQRMQY